MSESGSPTHEELLSHADFVRSLARRLLGDPHSADDVAFRLLYRLRVVT